MRLRCVSVLGHCFSVIFGDARRFQNDCINIQRNDMKVLLSAAQSLFGVD